MQAMPGAVSGATVSCVSRVRHGVCLGWFGWGLSCLKNRVGTGCDPTAPCQPCSLGTVWHWAGALPRGWRALYLAQKGKPGEVSRASIRGPCTQAQGQGHGLIFHPLWPVLTVQPREAEHADLVSDVTPGAGGAQGLQPGTELRPHQQDPIRHGLHVVLPAEDRGVSLEGAWRVSENRQSPAEHMASPEPAPPGPTLGALTTRQRAGVR